jgi:hypothetical protein
MSDSPVTPAELTVDHLEYYWRQCRPTVSQRGLVHEILAVGRVLGEMPAGMIAEDVDEWLHRRRSKGHTPAVRGYSDREFEAITAAARSEVAAIRSRLQRGQRLLTRYEREPDTLSTEERHRDGDPVRVIAVDDFSFEVKFESACGGIQSAPFDELTREAD